jgi:hypothetical protein
MMLTLALRQQRGNLLDELRRPVDHLACTIERHAGVWGSSQNLPQIVR